MSEPRPNSVSIFECPYCGAKHLYKRIYQPYYPEYEVKWSDLSNLNDSEKLSVCGLCGKVFMFKDWHGMRIFNADTKRPYKPKPWEAMQLHFITKSIYSKEETKLNGESIPHSIEIRSASTVLKSGNYHSGFEKDLRLMVWWEYNLLSKNQPTFSPIILSWKRQIKRQFDLLSVKLSNKKRMEELFEANKVNLERLLELDPDVTYKIEIYRNLGMFSEAEKIFSSACNAIGYGDHEDQFYWVFTRELSKRIKKRDKNIFGLRPVFRIV